MKTVLITGASRGMGKATAKKFLAEGWRVIGTSTDGEGRSNEHGFELVALDFLKPESILTAVENIKRLAPSIDVLINNAGVVIPLDRKDIDTINVERLRETLQVNLIGLIDFAERILLSMNEGGHIINVGSQSAILSEPLDDDDTDAPAYRISKTAINMYTKLLAKRLEKKGITVSSIDPGWVKTDMGGKEAQRLPEEVAQEMYDLATSKVESGQFWRSGKKRGW